MLEKFSLIIISNNNKKGIKKKKVGKNVFLKGTNLKIPIPVNPTKWPEYDKPPKKVPISYLETFGLQFVPLLASIRFFEV